MQTEVLFREKPIDSRKELEVLLDVTARKRPAGRAPIRQKGGRASGVPIGAFGRKASCDEFLASL